MQIFQWKEDHPSAFIGRLGCELYVVSLCKNLPSFAGMPMTPGLCQTLVVETSCHSVNRLGQNNSGRFCYNILFKTPWHFVFSTLTWVNGMPRTVPPNHHLDVLASDIHFSLLEILLVHTCGCNQEQYHPTISNGLFAAGSHRNVLSDAFLCM